MINAVVKFVVCCLILTADPPKEKGAKKVEETAKKDAEQLQGTWVCIYIEAGGGELTGQDFKDCKFDLIFKGDTVTMKVPSGEKPTFTFRLDPTTKPKSFDTFDLTGKRLMTKGIYHLEGDKFTHCGREVEDEKDERPKEFKSKKNTNIILMIFKRVPR